jgi:hypothetical protein
MSGRPRHVGRRAPARKGPAGRRPRDHHPSNQRRPMHRRTLYRLTYLAAALSLGCHLDHLIRHNAVGWPLTDQVDAFTISLVGYPIIATGLLLYQPAGWPGFGPCSAAAPPSSVPSTSAPAVVEVFTQVPTPDPTSCNGRPGSAPARSQPVAGRMTRRVVAFWVWTCSPSTDAVVPAPFSYKQDEDEGPERTSDGWPPATAHLPPEVNAADAMNTSSTPMQRPDAACGPLIVLDANPRYFTVASDARPSTSPTPTSGTTPQDAMGPGAITFYRSTVANFRAPAEPSDPTVLNLRKVG